MARAKAKAGANGPRTKSVPRKPAKSRRKDDGGAQLMEGAAEMPSPVEDAKLVLPDSCDSSSAASIKDLLVARRGAPLVVDAGQVNRVGVQTLQVLMAAANTWRNDGQSYAVTNPSAALLDTIALVGLSGDQFLLEGFSP
ncbi:STAS domain-containing protein [Hyphomicrobium facile]|uniref:Anti-anti-sigma regulatory factor (Antagonist of anti-sigma factor) n=1 Tax=Hyphomicrobium facile TaxID=51670 RepID=A0A1I7NR68_9HYPH|nr:STAS domain-containing protein [Hyphomicrobium facile]SFV37191.1 Anti-anti-sigma regulatory factor (antagonist of anti-sigma factor) [Hyphomicrobium facile]